ncbi:hypothetical protein [Amycolatopsis sp. WGS_07]|uniref:hypothetical protein n=1 Tax=Amycolatopsis sp. WGS_07 TaxID=3076764 RepID=UPI003873950F
MLTPTGAALEPALNSLLDWAASKHLEDAAHGWPGGRSAARLKDSHSASSASRFCSAARMC